MKTLLGKVREDFWCQALSSVCESGLGSCFLLFSFWLTFPIFWKSELKGVKVMGQRKQETSRPRRISLPIPLEGEIGLGDMLSRMTSAVGIKPCGGCKERAQKMNNQIIFQGKKKYDFILLKKQIKRRYL